MNKKIIASIVVFTIMYVGIVWFSSLMDAKSKPKEIFKYSELLPETTDEEIEIINQDGGEKYSFKLTNISEQYYYDYCYDLKEKGFTDVQYETNVSFGAYTDNGKYWVEAYYYNTDESSILVIVQKAKNYEDRRR